MNITRTRAQGDFHCPTCGSFREYKLKSRRPFLTLYLIPTIPIGAVEYFVRCQGCKTHWDPAILAAGGIPQSKRPEIEHSQFGVEAFRSAILVVLCDAQVSEPQIQALLRISERLLPEPISREELGQLCSSAHRNRITAANYVRSVCPNWSTQQRQLALQGMFIAATADRELDERKLQLLASLKETLKLSDEDYQAAIEAAIHWDPA